MKSMRNIMKSLSDDDMECPSSSMGGETHETHPESSDLHHEVHEIREELKSLIGYMKKPQQDTVITSPPESSPGPILWT